MEKLEKIKEEKLSYEELEQQLEALKKQNDALYRNLIQANTTAMLNRLNFLFKVLEFKSNFKSDFIIKCSDEITEMLTIPEEEEGE